jgi:hypothetical protein
MSTRFALAESPSGVGIVAPVDYILVSNGDGTWNVAPASSAGGVTSWDGRTGAVVPEPDDYSAADITSAVDGPHVSDSLAANKTAAANAQTTANTAVTNAAAAQTSANTAIANAATADAKAVAAQQPLKGVYWVNPLFAGTQLGSQSNPFTSIAACFAAAVTAGFAHGIIYLCPGCNTTENVTFPLTGEWEIAGTLSYGVFQCVITGNVTISSSASARRVLRSLQVTGNLSGNCSAGFQRVAILDGASINGTTTLTATGSGTNRLITGSPVNEFSGAASLQNFLTGAVTITGQFTGSSCVFGTSLGVTQTSSFVDCLMPPTTNFNTASGIAIYMQGCANTVGGSLAFNVVGGGFINLQCDGTTLEEFGRVGINVSGDIRMQSFMGGRSSTSTQVTNTGPNALISKLPAGLQVVDACLTLLANGGTATGNAVLSVTYTDATGTVVTEAVTTALNVAGALGSKARGSLQISQNGATAITFSVAGITVATGLSYKCDVAIRQAS